MSHANAPWTPCGRRRQVERILGLKKGTSSPDRATPLSGTQLQALARPRVCPQLVEDGVDPQPMLAAEEAVATWLMEQRTHGRQDRAPARVAAAFDDLKVCGMRP